ncbi:MAG: hypothetical protein OQJ89_08730 [Kangiellaceae bacterium]|nr:hypothetical protein [Kangiellaceae bacterium]MCW9017034.1 hypothetical protein [Kangiellaceae bacterium]
MKDKFSRLVEKFGALELRMRLMITFAAAMFVALVIDLFWLTPLNQDIERVRANIQQVERQINETLETQNQLNLSIANQRNHPKVKQLAQLKVQIEQARSLLKEKTSHLVAPSEMVEVLREIIQRSRKLKLISLTKQLPLPLFEQSDEQTKNNQQPQLQLYRHSVELVLDGNFKETQKFLEQLEKMEQQVEFNHFRFQVDQYPKSMVTLVVSTVSFERKWIGG